MICQDLTVSKQKTDLILWYKSKTRLPLLLYPLHTLIYKFGLICVCFYFSYLTKNIHTKSVLETYLRMLSSPLRYKKATSEQFSSEMILPPDTITLPHVTTLLKSTDSGGKHLSCSKITCRWKCQADSEFLIRPDWLFLSFPDSSSVEDAPSYKRKGHRETLDMVLRLIKASSQLHPFALSRSDISLPKASPFQPVGRISL